MKHKELIIRSFKKVRDEIIRETGIAPSITSCAIELSAIISETDRFSYGERSLRKLYKLSIQEPNGAIEIKQPQVVYALCNYLGYANYEDFVIKNNPVNKKENNKAGNILDVEEKPKGFGLQLNVFIRKKKLTFSIAYL